MKFWSDCSAVGSGRARRACGCDAALAAAVVGAGRRVEDDDVADRGVGEVVDEAVDEDPLADVERGLHRLRRDLVGLDQEGLDAERQPERQRDDDDELDQPAAAVFGFGIEGFSSCPRRSRVGLLGLLASASSSACLGSASASVRGRSLVLGLLARQAPRPPSAGASASSSASSAGASRPPPRRCTTSSWLTPSASSASALAAAAAATSSSSIPQRRSATRAALPTRPRR